MEKNKKQHEWILDGIDCANCASKVERGVATVARGAGSNGSSRRPPCRFDSDSLLYQLQIVKDYFDIRNNREVSADDCLASFRWIRDLHYGGKWNHSDLSRMVKKFVKFI